MIDTKENLIDEHSYLKICGGLTLHGEIDTSGAKNSILPILFASLLAEGEHIFTNVPNLKDVNSALNILSSLGLTYKREDSQLLVKNFNSQASDPCEQSAKSFRASVLCLGPLLARFGEVKIPLPGGCDIGSRPIDIHLTGLTQLGAKLVVEKGFIYGSVSKEGLKASHIELRFPSVGATENLIMACVLAKGTSYLKNLACEPEIEDLINYIKSLGALIERKGERELKITGVSSLKASSKPYCIIPDRIEAGTWLLATACTKGEIVIKKCQPNHMTALLDKLKASGFTIESKNTEIFLKSGKHHKAVNIKTGVYPFFSTDWQSQFVVLMTQLEGTSFLEEMIFEKRFHYIEQLNFLGAKIQKETPRKAFVKGPVSLKAHKMKARDLRAGAGLIIAGLVAEGESEIYGLQHVERGYENLFFKLKSLNADVELMRKSELTK